MKIQVDYDELTDIVNKIDDLVDNSSFIQNGISSIFELIEKDELFGITEKLNDKMEELENYNREQLETKLEEIRDEIGALRDKFDEQDFVNKEGIDA